MLRHALAAALGPALVGLAFLGLALVHAPVLRAEDAPAATDGLATAEEAKAALEAFAEAYKAQGTKGDERTALRDVAMRALAAVQHPIVTDRLSKLLKDKDADIRTLAAMHLGEQKKLAGYAGRELVVALQRNSTDVVFVMFCLDAIQSLEYRGAVEVFRTLLKHKDEGLRKHALALIGEMKDVRLLDDVYQLMVDLKIDKGMKWEGGEVKVDTGAAGTADQEAAERLYKEKYGQSAAKGKSGGRSMRDLKPTLLEAMKGLTGQEFITAAQAREWVDAHRDELEAKKKDLVETAKKQDEVAEEHEALAKATR